VQSGAGGKLPEEQARETIDAMLEAAGWCLQHRDALNLGAAPGVAVREFPLKTGFADYLLFVHRKAIGAVEAKAEAIHTELYLAVARDAQ
jgi:type I restriction enzyme R subunit